MKLTQCAPQKMSKYFMGSLALLASVVFFVLGISLVPVFGIIMSLPTLALAVYIFRLPLNDQCDIEPSA